MGFTSLAFLGFFPIVWLVYLLLPGRLRAVWLLVASYGFLGTFGIKYLAVLIGSTGVTWAAGMILENNGNIKRLDSKQVSETGLKTNAGAKSHGPAAAVFVAVITLHVAALCFFKYNRSNIALPVGLSFYTFQAIGYLADVYCGTIQAEHNLLNFALFQAFFPKLVQGPIERSGNLLRQIQNIETLPARDPERIRRSALLLLWGLCEKLLIADRIAIPVNAVYSQFGAFGGVEIILVTVLYAFQIYCDFAGYTDMARGIAGMLGFDLLANFKRPYQADSVQDFWRRWHLSFKQLASGLRLHPAGRQPERTFPESSEYPDYFRSQRYLAWNRLSFPALGTAPWRGTDFRYQELEAATVDKAASDVPVHRRHLDGVPGEFPGRFKGNVAGDSHKFPFAGFCRHAAWQLRVDSVGAGHSGSEREGCAERKGFCVPGLDSGTECGSKMSDLYGIDRRGVDFWSLWRSL